MSNFILLFGCLAFGFFAQYSKNFPTNSHQSINAFIVYVASPSVVLLYIPKITVSFEMLIPFLMGIIGLSLGFLFFQMVGLFVKFSKIELACLILGTSLSNTSLVGFPLVEMFYGQKALEVAVLTDQGSFVCISTIGILLMSYYAQTQTTLSEIFWRMFVFPPFIAFLFALTLLFLGLNLPTVFVPALEKLSSTLTPLALFSVGFQFKINGGEVLMRNLVLGLTYKLLIMPFLFWLIFMQLLGFQDQTIKVVILESAMPPMILAALLLAHYKLSTNLTNWLVGLGIIFCFLSVSFWYWFLG